MKITEKVEIKPSEINNLLENLSKTASTHTLSVSKNTGEGDYIGLREDNGGGCSGTYLGYNPNGGTITATVVYGKTYCITFRGTGSLQAHLDGVLILDETISGSGYWQVKAVFPPCEEPIVECENYEPPTIDESNFEVLSENQDWYWMDNEGNLDTANTGDYCLKAQSNKDKTIYGVTSALSSIGENMNGLSVYKTFSDIDIDVCLDGNENWNYSVNNLRIPIITSACTDYPESKGEIDLEDGKNYSLLEEHITNCDEFGVVMGWLNYFWIPGTYSGAKHYDEPKYFFSHGTLEHENEHVKQLKISITEEINNKDGLQKIQTNEYKLPKFDYPCPENAIEKKKEDIIAFLKKQNKKGSNLYKKYGLREGTNQYVVELEADELTISVRKKIKQNIKDWAKSQTWWDDNSVFCTSEL